MEQFLPASHFLKVPKASQNRCHFHPTLGNVTTSRKKVTTFVTISTSKIPRFYRHCYDVTTSTEDHPSKSSSSSSAPLFGVQRSIADSSVPAEDRGYTYDSAWNLKYRTNNGALTTFTVDNKNQLINYTG